MSTGQSGDLKGRFIGNNIRKRLGIMEFTDLFNIPGMIIFLDFEKAFDTVQCFFY